MKTVRYIFLTMFVAMCAMSMKAQQRNVLMVPDMRTQTGNVQLPIAIENTDEIVGAQFDITLPSGVTANAVGTMSNRSDGHSVTVTKVSSGAYRVLLHSTQNLPLRGQSGTVMYLPINIPSSFPEGSEYPIVVEKAVLGKSTGENVLTSVSAGKIYILKLPDLTVKSITCNKQTFAPGDHIVVSWQVQNVGELATGAGWGEQISLVSEDGSQSKSLSTTHYDEILGPSGVVSRQAEIAIPALLGMDGQARLQVRIVPDSKTGEPASAQGNNTQQGNNLLTINKVLTFDLSPTRVDENRNTRVSLKVTRSGRCSAAQTFPITATSDSRVPVPAEITIPANQAREIVYFNIVNNEVLDNDSIVNISVGGNGYSAVQHTLMVIDDEFPTLSLSANTNVVNEGDSIIFTVTAQRAPLSDVLLHLTCDFAKRFELPTGVFLRAGKTTAQLVTHVKDDDQPSTTVSPEFTVAADGYVAAKAVTILYDNDVPAISLSLTPTTHTESAGPVAMIAVLRRTTNTDKDITVRLSDDSESKDINYGQFSSISMPKGVEEVEFTIGINDNLIVDGDRDVNITAAVYIQSCSCSASGEDAGVVSQTVHIVDNDGPSLTLTSSRSMILEGSEEGTVLTISRNTPVTDPLTVNVTSNYDDGLNYSHNVVIPAGERTITVAVKALPNMNQGDSNTISFIAQSDGHSNGTCWVMVSDQTLPDAIVSSLQLLTKDGDIIGENGVTVNDWLQARITIENIGVINFPAGIPINIYQNSRQTATLTTPQSIAPGESIVLTCNVKASDQVGNFTIFAKVNEDKTTQELLYANNTSATASVMARALFTATVNVDKNTLLYGDSVTISGQLARANGTTWEGDDNTSVVLYLLADGQRFTQSVTADADGEFSYVWKPSRFQMGHIGIGACYPGEALYDEMAYVDIYGLRHKSSAPTTFYNVIDQPYTGSFSIVNPGRLPLTGLSVSVADNTDGASITFDAPQRIEGGESVNINFTIIGHKLAVSNDWQTFKFNITTDEGAELSKTIYYYTRNVEAQLNCSVKQINTTMTKGTTRDYMFNVANIGMGSTGTISLSLPQWMQSVTPMEMAPLEQGDTTQIVIRFVPTDDMQLNVPITGQIAINCENGNGLAIPFRIEPVSEINGDLMVDVCDEYTYYTDEAPHVCGATVTILHPTTGSVIAKDTTDVNGCFNVTLPEGYYTLLVTHPKHNSYRANILLDPGKTTYKVVNLSYDAINVSWDVEETTVEDVYDIVTTVKYETNVPAPVVLVNMPNYIPAKELSDGESLVFYVALTNVGLITAKGVEFGMPSGFNVLTYEPLDFVDESIELAPQQSIFIPIKVTNTTGTTGPSKVKRNANTVKPVDDDPCYAQFPLSWFYECGTDSVFHKYPTGISVGKCEEKPSGGVTGGGGYGGFGGFGGAGGGAGSPTPGKYFTTINYDYVKPVSTGEPYKCTPCSNSAFISLAKVFGLGPLFHVVDEAKDAINCAMSVSNNDNWHDRLAGCKYTEKLIQSYDVAANVIQDLCEDYQDLKSYGGKLVDQIYTNRQFTDDVFLKNLKGFCDEYFEMKDDLDDLSCLYDKFEENMETVRDHWNQTKEFYDDLKKTEEIVETDKYLWDIEINEAASTPHKNKDSERIKGEIDRSLQGDIASEGDYLALLEATWKTVVDGEKLGREQTKKTTRAGIKVAGDLANSMNNIPGLSEAKSATEDAIIKNAAVQTTNELLEKADDIADLLHYSFGDCEYEGPDDGHNPEEGGDNGGNDNSGKEGGQHAPRKVTSIRFNQLPYSYKLFLDKLEAAREFLYDLKELEEEFFGSPEWLQLTDAQMVSLSWAMERVKEDETAVDNPNIYIYCPENISDEAFHQFLVRYANTIRNAQTVSSQLKAPAYQFPITSNGNCIDQQHIEDLKQSMNQHISTILQGEDGTISEVLQKYYQNAYDDLSERSNTVCASITLQFNQTMTMTRQAFRGTLKVHNGNADGAMENVILQLEVRNASDGSLATSREMYMGAESLEGFEGPLNLTDGWTLSANGDGTATILFIPSKYAAPTEAQDYTFGGRLSYLDPFSGTVVTRELSPVTLTVKPSPELDLTYFMQRDVYGDDPLTMDVVEPVKPAEFALLINNKGYGDATDVKMVTQQPEIVDNQKGLYVNFELISSQVNGAPATLSFGQTITNNFGTIPAHSQMYAQWWLTSSLLGHFTDYDVQATHVTSYGNEDLSLLDQVTIHELVHGFDLSTNEQQLRAFLVNDLPDSEDLPDMLYFSDGETADVSTAASSSVEKTSSTTCTLTIVPSGTGWNYGNLLDPTHGMATIQSIVRQSDGKEMAADNFWQTDRTLRDGSDPLYENRLHFIDDFASQSAETYVITFEPVPEVLLEVESIAVVPAEDTVAEDPVDQLTVTFSKPIDPLTFTADDIAFVVQGTKQDASQIGITTENNQSFVLDLKTLTEQCPNGYYTLTVQTSDITDNEGYQGKTGKQVGWILYRGGLVQLLTSVFPLESGSIQRAESAGVKARRAPTVSGTAAYGSDVTLTATPAEGFEFLNWTLNGEVVSTDPEFTAQAIGDMDVVANFTKKNYLVEVASENGTVSGTAMGYYQHGDLLTLTAKPDADYVFTGWMVNGVAAGTNPTLTLTLDKALDIKANFVRDIYHQKLSLNRGWNWVSSYLREPQAVDVLTNSSSRVLAQFDELIRDPEYGMVGGITAFEPAVAYKVNASSAYIHILNGHLYNLAASPMTVKRGWNWIAYPYWQTKSVDDVLINSEEGDYITAQTGFAEYADGCWQGSLTTLEPGAGYMYKSASDKTLAFDFEEKDEAGVKGFKHSNMELAPVASPAANVDIHQYPNTMNITATLTRNGEAMDGTALIYAFAGDELRGVSRYVGTNYYLTVYGEQPVEISFIIEDTTTGELATANETLTFRNDVVGSRKSPYAFTMGEATDIDVIGLNAGPMTVYGVDGRLISKDATQQSLRRLPKGIYIVNGHKCYVK